jgi:hypothetical protein
VERNNEPEAAFESMNNIEKSFPLGTLVRKKSGSEWVGRVVGYYSTKLTPEGICVESSSHAGSVQIYPTKAMEVVQFDAATRPIKGFAALVKTIETPSKATAWTKAQQLKTMRYYESAEATVNGLLRELGFLPSVWKEGKKALISARIGVPVGGVQ